MPRSTFLFGFKAPVVKGPETIVLPVLLAGGEWTELETTPGTLRNIGKTITQHFAAEPARATVPSHANPSLRQPMLKRSGKIL